MGKLDNLNTRIEKSIENTRTKYCMPVMEILYHNPNIRQVDIARALEIPPSNLQGIMKKILMAEPALVYCIPMGKAKGYVLSEEAGEYFSQSNAGKNEVENPFEEWEVLTGSEHWRDRLRVILEGISEPTAQEGNALHKIQEYMEEHSGTEKELYAEELVGRDLWSQLKNYVPRQADTASKIRPLYQLYSSQWKTACHLTDYILDDVIYGKKDDFFQVFKAFDLADETAYFDIKFFLMEMTDKCRGMLKKGEIYQRLVLNKDMDHPLTFYIAEKIYMANKRNDIIVEKM